MTKYRAVRSYSELCQRWFASKVECRRGEELALLEKGGAISGLEYQPKFGLCTKPYKVTYTADFRYIEDGKTIIEDVKGVLTRDTRTKIAWLYERGIEITLRS